MLHPGWIHLVCTTSYFVMLGWWHDLNIYSYAGLAVMCLSAGMALREAHITGHHRNGGIWWLLGCPMLSESYLARLAKQWLVVHTRGHHVAAYPKIHFTRHDYFNNTESGAGYLDALMYGGHMICIITPIYLLLQLNWRWTMWMGFIIGLIGLLYVEDYIHHEIHLTHSWLDEYEWFRYLREVHRLHHTHPYTTNYAIVALWLDVLGGTFTQPTRSVKRSLEQVVVTRVPSPNLET